YRSEFSQSYWKREITAATRNWRTKETKPLPQYTGVSSQRVTLAGAFIQWNGIARGSSGPVRQYCSPQCSASAKRYIRNKQQSSAVYFLSKSSRQISSILLKFILLKFVLIIFRSGKEFFLLLCQLTECILFPALRTCVSIVI